ncbi:membrane protein insertase YidC [Candidatus Bipolaricaulota bacterium]|nr:membrane protein insertase YidC [Candidatus Bipolaricaulota bacterium]MBS3814007.1 membrane protein insertase YidC [Candidatus Bipolaricaulota bacterium]
MQFTSFERPKALTSFLILVLFSLFLLGPTAAGAPEEYKQPITVDYHEEKNAVKVETEIATYLFSKQGGNLRSIFIHFSPFRSQKAELVPGTSIDPETEETSYMEGIKFPGELTVRGESDGNISYEVIFPEGQKGHYNSIPITFTATLEGIEVKKTYTVYNNQNYTLGFSLSLTNRTDQGITLGEETRVYVASRVETGGDGDVKYLEDISVDSLRDDLGRVEGLGLIGNGLVLFLKTGLPTQDPGDATYQELSANIATEDVSVGFSNNSLTSGETKDYQFSLYGGRQRHVLLSNVGLEEIDDIGIFSQLLVPVIGFLNLLYDFTGNYGWAIILFTVLIRVLLYPLMRNMYRSMAKMQELQPKIKKIQDEYEDKEEQQKKMMALYKEEGVNPLGGCLPMFIQLPILILLWRAIMYSAEAIHMSPGFLWLSDLSMRDPTYVLVVLTVGTMILQQQMMQTPGGGGSQNKIMSYGFPLFMGVFLRNFPAGLWLYYLLTQLFMIGQQAFINWEMDKEES